MYFARNSSKYKKQHLIFSLDFDRPSSLKICFESKKTLQNRCTLIFQTVQSDAIRSWGKINITFKGARQRDLRGAKIEQQPTERMSHKGIFFQNLIRRVVCLEKILLALFLKLAPGKSAAIDLKTDIVLFHRLAISEKMPAVILTSQTLLRRPQLTRCTGNRHTAQGFLSVADTKNVPYFCTVRTFLWLFLTRRILEKNLKRPILN
jgi:hypothetical protein